MRKGGADALQCKEEAPRCQDRHELNHAPLFHVDPRRDGTHTVGMSWRIIVVLLALAGICAAQERKKGKAAEPKLSPPAAVTPPRAEPVIERKLETFVLLPEPKAMRTARSRQLPDAKETVVTAALEVAESPGVRAYTAEEFAKVGISLDSFIERARAAADKRLATLQPDYGRDESGRVRYAVYRGDSPLMASLLMAPSLARIFKNIFGDEIWAACPDRHALYVFPAKPQEVAEFTADLRERFEGEPYAASPEIFLLKDGEPLPRVIGSFSN